MEELTSNYLNLSAHKTEGITRTKNMRFYPTVFTGKERDGETGFGYFGARYMDHELMTMWLSVDPMADKYPNISPYAYCAWNPVKLVDPDGRDVLPTSDEAFEMILRTLPSEARTYVQRNSEGYIDRDLINSYECGSSNFNDLKTLVNLDCGIEVSVSSQFDVLLPNGTVQTNKDFSLYEILVDPNFVDAEGTTISMYSTGEVGWSGVTQYPEASSSYPSTNENIKVHINSQLSSQGRAEAFAHEFFGHAFIYATTGDVQASGHDFQTHPNGGQYDANTNLTSRIINAKMEVLRNNR